MGRKIPAKKHHGVKDPEKQKEKRLAKIKTKINNKPGKDDFQEIPKSLRLMMEARENVKAGNLEKEKPRHVLPPEERGLLDSRKHMTYEMKLPGMKRPLKPVPVFKQQPGENKRSFYHRMDKTIQGMKSRRQWENRYGVDVTTDEHGQTKVVDHEKDEVELEIEKKKKDKLLKKGIVVKSKEEKRKIRREREKMRKNKNRKKNEDVLDFSDYQDNVGFGETVHEPPTLKELNTETRKPGQKDLLLKKNLEGVKKKKVKDSLAKKVIMEKERKKAVELYRALKAQKLQSTN